MAVATIKAKLRAKLAGLRCWMARNRLVSFVGGAEWCFMGGAVSFILLNHI